MAKELVSEFSSLLAKLESLKLKDTEGGNLILCVYSHFNHFSWCYLIFLCKKKEKKKVYSASWKIKSPKRINILIWILNSSLNASQVHKWSFLIPRLWHQFVFSVLRIWKYKSICSLAVHMLWLAAINSYSFLSYIDFY